jgi:predicted acetyltransferase
VLGHIGYAVVPWKQQAGCATAGLRLMLLEAQWRHLAHVEISTSPHNLASRRVVERNAGVLVDTFVTPDILGAEPVLRYRIDLARPAPAAGTARRGAAASPT